MHTLVQVIQYYNNTVVRTLAQYSTVVHAYISAVVLYNSTVLLTAQWW